MASKRCMNGGCGATAAAGEWKKGWGLRSGGFANLCEKCGTAYEQSVFCDLFHPKESGWRECFFCGKRLHCGCIASKSSLDLLDGGGVQCISCMQKSGLSFIPGEATQEFMPQSSQRDFPRSLRGLKDERLNNDFSVGSKYKLRPTCIDQKIDDGKLVKMGKNSEVSGQTENVKGSFGNIKPEHMTLHLGELGSASFSNRDEDRMGSSHVCQRDDGKEAMTDNVISESLTQACLSISLGCSNRGNIMQAAPTSGTRHITMPLSYAVEEGRDQNTELSPLQQVQRARHLLPRPSKADQNVGSDSSKEVLPHMRVARPPGEGKGRYQLLPRYWPRITDQELQQISGDPNSTIVPLFEKVLSASDAGRIGRLVLPKACAEAYFPPISQPEGLPLKIQDSKGKDWHFQFRFWPNNNSRMYVLEGVTPCIQSLQLRAGDTVTFSRMDPEGKLVLGFRKATNSVPLQDSQISAIANATLGNETFLSGVNENLPIVSGYSGLPQSFMGTADLHLSCLSEHLNSADGDVSWQKTDKLGARANEGSMVQPLLFLEKKRSRYIGTKSKRLHMDNEDALELKFTWEEAQDLLRPPLSVKPSVVVIEDQEFEEYEEPPVFGKRSIFTVQTFGEQDQWIQCDDCFKWRRLPVDVLVSSKWTCADNTHDPKRSSCSVPDELNSRELQNLLQQHAEIKRRRTSSKQNPSEFEVSGLDALATAAALGDAVSQATVAAASTTTTKHPRHRPGCSCIVCIQPPSGKGPKHDPSCPCNVCMTVRRRFTTLMMRKKKRQSEREEAEANKKLQPPWGTKEETEGSTCSLKGLQSPDSLRESELGPEYGKALAENVETVKGQIDLNFRPERDGEQQAVGPSSASRMSMMNLLQVASLPLENYLKQNGLTSLACEQQVSSSSATIPQSVPVDESEERTPEEGHFGPGTQEREGGSEGNCSSDKILDDAA